MLKKRILTSVWYVSLLVVVVWFASERGLTLLVAVFGILAALEFYRMVAATKPHPFTYFGLVWTALFILVRSSELLSFRTPFFTPDVLIPLLLTSGIIAPLIGVLVRRQREGAFDSWIWTVAGILYTGWLFSHLVALRGLDNGQNWVFFVLFVTWASDTAAYVIGSRFGRHKLAPKVSPGKSWEGVLGGVLAAILTSVLLFTATPFYIPLVYWQLMLLAVVVGACGQLGDLVESLLKRNMGVKDSGNLMPGHGGVLDRIDSLIFSGAVVYYVIYYCCV